MSDQTDKPAPARKPEPQEEKPAADAAAAAPPKKGSGLFFIIVLAAAVILAAAGGVVLASMLTGGKSTPPEPKDSQNSSASPRYVFVPFGSVVVNLADEKLTRYLKVTITLQVASDSATAVERLVSTDRAAVFKDWIITTLSDKDINNLKGTANINKLRREVADGFNEILAQYGKDRVEAVFFEELNVQ